MASISVSKTDDLGSSPNAPAMRPGRRTAKPSPFQGEDSGFKSPPGCQSSSDVIFGRVTECQKRIFVVCDYFILLHQENS